MGLRAVTAITVVAAIAAGMLAADRPFALVSGLVLVAAAIAVAMRPERLIYLTVALAVTTVPAVIPTTFSAGGLTFRFYEPLLVLAGVYVWARHRPPGYATTRFAVLVGLLGAAAAVGYLSGNVPAKILFDVRWPMLMAVALYVGAGIAGTPIVDRCVRLLPWLMWLSAGVILLASAVGLALPGRAEAAALGNDATSEATRLLTPSTFPALVVLCAAAALVIARRAAFRSMLVLIAPAFVVVFLGFSRNHLLGLAVAVAFTILAMRNADTTIGLFGRAALVAVPTALIGGVILAALPPGSWLDNQVGGYSARVLDGLSSESLNTDPSTQFRLQENRDLSRAIEDAPVIGHGLGFAYRPGTGPPGQYMRDQAPYYAHNFYLWALVKAGFLGLLAFGYVMLTPVLSALRSPSSTQLAAGAAAAALLAVSVVAPVPLGSPTAVLLGALLGLLAGARGMQGRDPEQKPKANRGRAAYPTRP